MGAVDDDVHRGRITTDADPAVRHRDGNAVEKLQVGANSGRGDRDQRGLAAIKSELFPFDRAAARSATRELN